MSHQCLDLPPSCTPSTSSGALLSALHHAGFDAERKDCVPKHTCKRLCESFSTIEVVIKESQSELIPAAVMVPNPGRWWDPKIDLKIGVT